MHPLIARTITALAAASGNHNFARSVAGIRVKPQSSFLYVKRAVNSVHRAPDAPMHLARFRIHNENDFLARTSNRRLPCRRGERGRQQKKCCANSEHSRHDGAVTLHSLIF